MTQLEIELNPQRYPDGLPIIASEGSGPFVLRARLRCKDCPIEAKTPRVIGWASQPNGRRMAELIEQAISHSRDKHDHDGHLHLELFGFKNR